MPKIIVYLKKSNRPGKKYMVYVDGKTVHFGASGMSDYTKHKDKERMKRYSARHSRGGETWSKSGLKTAGFWSKWLLWNKPTISGSKRDISSRFNVTFKSGWPKKSSPMKYSRKSKRRSRKSKRKSRKSRKGKRHSRKGKRRSRKGKRRSRKSKRRSRKSRKGKRRSRKSKRHSRKGKRRSRKSKRRSRKGKRHSRKGKHRSRKGNRRSRKTRKMHKNSKAKSHFRKVKSRKSKSGKYEDCVLKVKAKQPKHCMKRGKWVGGKGCYNPWAVCTKSVGRDN